MDNVDYYMAAEKLADKYPNDELSITFKSHKKDLSYIDTPERLKAAKALIAKHSKK